MTDDTAHRFSAHLRRAGRAGTTVLVILVSGGLVAVGSDIIAATHEEAPQVAAVEPVVVRTRRLTLQDSYSVPARYDGQLEARRKTALGFEAGGTVAEVLADEGDTVAAGEVLARLDTRALGAERAAQVAARDALEAERELARLTAGRQKVLAERDFASAQRYDEARLGLQRLDAEIRRTEAQIQSIDVALSKAELVAPFDGRVGARLLDEGAGAAAGQPVLELLENAVPRFRVGVPAGVAATLEPGQSVTIRIDGRDLTGQLTGRRSDVDHVTRTVSLLFDVPGAAGTPAGSLGTLRIERTVGGSGAWVPLTALSEGTRGLWTLYLLDAADEVATVRRESVELLYADAERAYVRGAFAVATRYVAEGPHRVSAGQAVRDADAQRTGS